MLMYQRNQGLMPSILNELMSMSNYSSAAQGTMPKTNVTESEADYQVELCVPGLAKEDLSLSVDSENNLVVEMAKLEEPKEAENEHRYLRKEFGRLKFKQVFSLPENVKKEGISAKVSNGILTIVLPKFTDQEKQDLMQKIVVE